VREFGEVCYQGPACKCCKTELDVIEKVLAILDHEQKRTKLGFVQYTRIAELIAKKEDEPVARIVAGHHCGFDFKEDQRSAMCSCGAITTNPYYVEKEKADEHHTDL